MHSVIAASWTVLSLIFVGGCLAVGFRLVDFAIEIACARLQLWRARRSFIRAHSEAKSSLEERLHNFARGEVIRQ